MKGSGDFLFGGVIDTSFDLVYTFIRPIANQEPLLKIHYRPSGKNGPAVLRFWWHVQLIWLYSAAYVTVY